MKLFKEDCKKCANKKCALHPNYKVKRRPSCNCKVCWEIWERKNGKESNKNN